VRDKMLPVEQCSYRNIVPRGNMEKTTLKNSDTTSRIPSLDPWFVSGFCDGEAAFTFSRSGQGFSLYFSVRQREDNIAIVHALQNYFGGVGKIYLGKEQFPTKNSGHSKPTAYFRVCKQDDLLRIVEHFDKFPLQSKKQEVYTVWKDMVIDKTKNSLNCQSDKFKLFAERLAVMNQKSRAFKKHSR